MRAVLRLWVRQNGEISIVLKQPIQNPCGVEARGHVGATRIEGTTVPYHVNTLLVQRVQYLDRFLLSWSGMPQEFLPRESLEDRRVTVPPFILDTEVGGKRAVGLGMAASRRARLGTQMRLRLVM